jgi:ribosomal protein L37AE/L43A
MIPGLKQPTRILTLRGYACSRGERACPFCETDSNYSDLVIALGPWVSQNCAVKFRTGAFIRIDHYKLNVSDRVRSVQCYPQLS